MTESRTEAAVEQLAAELATDLPSGAVIWLEGPLGAGKTTFARAFLGARGAREAITSPTYAIAHHHEGSRGSMYHLDCYRMRSPSEAADLDWELIPEADVLLIEWPERAGEWAPPATVRVQLDHAGEFGRTVQVTR